MQRLLHQWSVHTVCHSAACPNHGECFSQKKLTFMIMGKVCTRNCTFCNVTPGKPLALDTEEPERVAAVARELGLSYVVVTSVTRDDLPDGGAVQFARTIQALKKVSTVKGVEVLIPDFKGSLSDLEEVVRAQPTVLDHNLETVPRLYTEVRPQAHYGRSLQLLRRAKTLSGRLLTKSGLMLGLGEQEEEVMTVLADLRGVDCDFLTLGQYLRPSRQHHPVIRYVTPEEFQHYQDMAERMGFRGVASAPLVRSSFNAESLWQTTQSGPKT